MSGTINYFCELTGCDSPTAKLFLDANDGNLQMALNRYFSGENPKQSQPGLPSPFVKDSNHQQHGRPAFEASNNMPSTSFSNNKIIDLSLPENASSSDQERVTWEQLFAHPHELMFPGNLKQVMEAARLRRKWLLVSLYDGTCFDCRVLNRDVWKDCRIISLIKKNVLFTQLNIKSSDGILYRNRFTYNDMATHIAFVNPFTGEQTIFWNHLKSSCDIFEVLSKYLLAYPTPLDSDYDNCKISTLASPSRSALIETVLSEPAGAETKSSNASVYRNSASSTSSALTFAPIDALSTARPSTSFGLSDMTRNSSTSACKRRNVDYDKHSAAGPTKRSLMEDDDADSLRFFDLALEEEEEETMEQKMKDQQTDSVECKKADSQALTEEAKAARLLKELPPISDPAKAFRIALRFPCGLRTVFDLEPSLRLRRLFSYFKYQGYPSSKFELIRVYPRLRLNDLPPTCRIDESGLARYDSLFLQTI